MNINKEKITCMAAAVLLAAGFAYTAANWGGGEKVVHVTPRSNTYVAVPIEVPDPLVLKPESAAALAGNGSVTRDNPFLSPSRRRPATIEDYPLPHPVFLPVAKNIPVPGTFTDSKIRPMLMQRKPPEDRSGNRERPDRNEGRKQP